jgi:hypothetical protein
MLISDHLNGRSQELEAETCLGDFGQRFREGFQDREARRLRVLVDRLHDRGDALDLGIQCCDIQVVDHIFHFLLFELNFSRAAPYNCNDFLHFFLAYQKMRDIEHDVARANDRTAFSKMELLLAERRQMIVIIDDILGVINAFQILPWQTKPLGALRPHRDEDRLKSERTQIVEREITLRADRNVSIIIKVGHIEHLAKLLAQAALHGMFIGINSIFCKSARFDVTIEYDYPRALVGKLACTK